MKFSGVLALAAVANAQYFSGGWVPGQAVTAENAAPSAGGGVPSGHKAQPAEPFSFSSLFDMNKILSSGPVKGLFDKAGINITERLEAAAVSPWDDRIPLITDENYHDMVVNEAMTPEEERDRVWVIVVCVPTPLSCNIRVLTTLQIGEQHETGRHLKIRRLCVRRDLQ
jgi:hypothetical protein